MSEYKKIKVLGRGAFGSVYQAENIKKPGELVAVKKFLHKSRDEIPVQTLREINIIKLLTHPNIISIKEIIIKNNNIKLILEYGGISLRSYYEKANYKDLMKHFGLITYQLISGCLYMHKSGVLHRDLKPENILINFDEGQRIIKICDFGLSKKVSPVKNDRNTYQICTLYYRPPELFTKNNQVYDNSVDVWSLGCVLYEMMVGKPIFKGSTEIVVLRK